MINNCYICSGINKDNVNDMEALANYLGLVEEKNDNFCVQLNEIIDNEPKVLYEPTKINELTTFPLKDLAFIHCNDKIVGHLLYVFSRREKTTVGHTTQAHLSEMFSFVDIPDNYLDQYIMQRLEGKLELGFDLGEKSIKKQI